MKKAITKQQRFSRNSWTGFALLLCLVLLALQVGFLCNQPWVGDYWEHRAVLLELLQRPFEPQHPIVRSDQPHPFYSPYLVGWALAGRAAGASVVALLNTMAVVNLLLWLGAVYLLSHMFLPRRNPAHSFAVLALTLLLCWGFDPPNYSSFFHFSTLLYVMPYPSTFSFVAAVGAAWLYRQFIHNIQSQAVQLLQLTGFTLLTAVILLTHPLTFFLLLMLAGIVYMQAAQQQQKWMLPKPLLALTSTTAAAFALCSYWPWYPFWQLLQYAEGPHRFHADSRELYSNIYLELYPLLLPGFLMALQPRSYWKQQLPYVAALVFAGVLFFYGWFSEQYGWGRMLAFGTLIAQLLVVRFVLCTPSRVKGTLILILTLVLALPYVIRAVSSQVWVLQRRPAVLNAERASTTALLSPAAVAQQLSFIPKLLPAGSLVLANRYCNKYLPGYGLRVVAAPFPAYFTTAAMQQQLNWERFFEAATTPAERALVLQHLHPNAILLGPDERWLLAELQTRHSWLMAKEKNSFTLLVPKP